MLLVVLTLSVAFMGGSSRFDALQSAPLRSISAFLFVVSIFYLDKVLRVPVAILASVFMIATVLIAIQLVPMPVSLWEGLPDRHAIRQLDMALGLEGHARPITLAPARTWNALGSLVIPWVTFALAIVVNASSHALLRLVAAMGVLNALLGLSQIAFPGIRRLYLYELTNFGSPVGIFANENHSSVFAACSLLVITLLGLKARHSRASLWRRFLYPVFFSLILLVLLVGGSRAGFVAGIVAVFASLAMVLLSLKHFAGRRSAKFRSWFDARPRFTILIPIAALLLAMSSFLVLDRAPAFRDIIAKDNLDDLRWQFWPVVLDMCRNHWLLGAGVGSFEQVYYTYEPPKLLMPRYINQAHNDWLQLLVEGGVIAMAALSTLLFWLSHAIRALMSRPEKSAETVFWISILAILSAASLVDYPLRTPIFQVAFIFLLIVLARDIRKISSSRRFY